MKIRIALTLTALLLALPLASIADDKPATPAVKNQVALVFTQDATMVPEGDVELEFWFDYVNVQSGSVASRRLRSAPSDSLTAMR